MDIAKVDKRFQSVFYDRRFRSIRQKQRKIKIDHRFLSMFKDDKFKLQYYVDKRGRPIQESTSENLQKYYRVSNKEKRKLKLERIKEKNRLTAILNGIDEHGVNRKLLKDEVSDDKSKSDSESNLSSDVYSSSEEESENEIDLARGEGNIESSTDEEEEEEKDEHVEMIATEGHNWNQLDENADRSENVTKRLALCNMDWDRIKADDLMVLFNGFKPAGSSIKQVTIYPSDFGAKRLAEENLSGPVELLKDDFDELNDTNETEKEQNEKFRKHQISRLKYYYAVIECDSLETAEHIYNECDGIEYESSSSKIDLRFIPDDIAFDDHPPKDICNFVPDKDQYKPSNFVTTALNQGKVQITWDETDHGRVQIMTKKYNEDDLADMDMQVFLASSSEEEEEEEKELKENELSSGKSENMSAQKIGISSKTTDQDQITRYRSLLLGEIEEDAKDDSLDDVDMEITWEPGLDEFGANCNENDDINTENEDTDDEAVKETAEVKPKSKKRKRQNKKKEIDDDNENNLKEKAELEMLMIDAEDAKLKHFDINQLIKEQKMSKKKKRKLGLIGTEDNFNLNMDDPRFSSIFTSSDFALDPNSPAFKKTKAMKKLIEERQNRLQRLMNDGYKIASEKTVASEQKLEKQSNNNVNKDKLINSIKTKTNKLISKRKSLKMSKINKKT